MLAACTPTRRPGDASSDRADLSAVPADGPEQLIAGARVFDGHGVLDGKRDVLVRGERIAEVAPRIRADAATRIDGEGCTLLPGLIDAHTHTSAPRDTAKALLFGVTTELGMYCYPEIVEQVKAMQEGQPVMADLRSSGYLATAPGGHGTQFDPDRPPTLRTPEEAESWVEARLAEGSDYIKIVLERRDDFEPLDADVVAALAEAAHARDRLAVTHISEQELARQAVDAGTDGLVHVWADGGDPVATAAACRDAGVFVVATLAVIHADGGARPLAPMLDDPRIAPWLTGRDDDHIRAAEVDAAGPAEHAGRDASAAVAALHEAGVPVLAGSDPPNPGVMHGTGLHAELELLVEAGLAPPEALAAATGRVAERFGLDDRGGVAPGLRADLLLVDGDPTTDITATRGIREILKAGQRVDRDEVKVLADLVRY